MPIAKILCYFSILFFLTSGTVALSQGTADTSEDFPPEAAETALSYREALVLGLVEGLTEFLPVSSTGHLILASHLLGLKEKGSAENLISQSAEPEGSPYSVKSAVDAYSIVIQFGAIAAVALVYWSRITSIFLGLAGKSREGLLLGRNLLAAFVPAVVIGLLLEDIIDTYLFNNLTVATALMAGGLLIFIIDGWQKRAGKSSSGNDLQIYDLTLRQSILVGLFQCIALWPGASRSLMAIVGGYAVGLKPWRAAEFSFLLGLPTLTGAALYKGLKAGPEMLDLLGLGPVIFGCLVAAISAGLSVTWMVRYLTRHGLSIFGWYRIAVAAWMFAFII